MQLLFIQLSKSARNSANYEKRNMKEEKKETGNFLQMSRLKYFQHGNRICQDSEIVLTRFF